MADVHEELFELASRLERLAERGRDPKIIAPVQALKTAAEEVGRAFSGSWQGYHAFVYYAGLQPRPPGAQFSQEWGLMDVSFTSLGSHGDWREYDPEEVKAEVRRRAGEPDMAPARAFFDDAAREFDGCKSEALSMLSTALEPSPDGFLNSLKNEAEELSIATMHDVVEHLRPRGSIMTRDTVVLGQGQRIPPHLAIKSEAFAIENAIGSAGRLADIARKAGSHLLRKAKQRRKSEVVGTNVFIGHGGSLLWRELKDFIEDRLSLPTDEFNRVPVAGVTNIARLSEMLDAAAIAFLVMTGEDEQKDGRLHARMNVVHEAGLFQGRLGFNRAIVVLEEGCDGFSNIEGLGQIRFPKGNVKAVFEDVRRVLERERLIATG